tara:strand:+ start:7999 stop:8799 length:801 start_codon:yes stop_codon:yes gene_type:complete
MRVVVYKSLNLLLIWGIPTLLLLVSLPADPSTEQFAKRFDGRNQIGVSFIHMFLPTLMGFTQAPPWQTESSWMMVENMMVHTLCIVRVCAAIALFSSHAKGSGHVYMATMFAMFGFIYFKTWQKPQGNEWIGHALTHVGVVCIFLFIVVAEPELETLTSLGAILRLCLFGQVVYAEMFYTSVVERRKMPNGYILCALVLWCVSDVVQQVIVMFAIGWDDVAAINATFAFGFVMYFVGVRHQEKQREAEVIARFEEVPREDDGNDLI